MMQRVKALKGGTHALARPATAAAAAACAGFTIGDFAPALLLWIGSGSTALELLRAALPHPRSCGTFSTAVVCAVKPWEAVSLLG